MMTPYLRYRLRTISERTHTLQAEINAVGKIWSPFLYGGLPGAVLRAISSHTPYASCVTVEDARQLAEAGFQSIIITRPVVDSEALKILARMTPQHEMTVVVDHFRQAELLSHALTEMGSVAQVLLDVDIGRQTTGVRPGPDSVNLAAAISQLPRVCLRGIFLDDRCNSTSMESPSPALSFAESLAVACHCQRMIESTSCNCREIVTAFDAPADAFNAKDTAVVMSSPMRCPTSPKNSPEDSSVDLACRVLSRPSLEWCVVDAPHRVSSTWNLQTVSKPRGATLLHACGDVSTLVLSGESRDLRIGDEISLSAEAFVARERHDLPFVIEA